MNFKLGMDAKLYLGTSLLSDTETVTTNTWTEQPNVKDVTISLETGETDVTTRANNGWRATAATLKNASIEFEMIWKPGDAGLAKIKDAWKDNTEIAVLALTGDKTEADNEGPVGNWMVTNMSRAEPLEEAITVSVTMKPSSFTDWHTVAGA